MEPQNEPIQQEAPLKKRVNINTPAAIITAGALIALALILGRGAGPTDTVSKKTVETQPLGVAEQPLKPVSLRPTDPVRGDVASSDVVIIEYSDSDCPYCQRFHNTMKEVMALSSVKVAWAYRYFPLSIHPNAQNEAIALACVQNLGGNDAFWKYLDNIIDITLSPEKSASILTGFAKDEGIDTALFTKCIADPKIAKMISDQSTEAQALGAKGTPFSIIINTKTNAQAVIPGALPAEQVKQLIDGLLKK